MNDSQQPTQSLQSHVPDFHEATYDGTAADRLEIKSSKSLGDESLGARIARLADSLREVAEQLPLQQIYQGIEHHKSEESFSGSEMNRVAHISQSELLLKLESTSKELEETVMHQLDVQNETGPTAPIHQPPSGLDHYDLYNLPSLFNPTPPRHSPVIQDLPSYAPDSVLRREGHESGSPYEHEPIRKPAAADRFDSIDSRCLLDNERSNVQMDRRQTCLSSQERMLDLTSSEGARTFDRPSKLSITTSQPNPPRGSHVYGVSTQLGPEHNSFTPKSSNTRQHMALSADKWSHLSGETKSADPPGNRVGSFEEEEITRDGGRERVRQRSDPPECQERPEYHFSTPKSRKRSQRHARFDTTDSRDPPDSTEKDRISTTRPRVLRHPPSPTRRREQPSSCFSPSQKPTPSPSHPAISPSTKPSRSPRRSTPKSREGLQLSIPSWIGDGIKQSHKPLLSPGESSMDRLFRTIDEIEDDFESIISSMPGSQDQSSLLGTEEGNQGGFLSRTERQSDSEGTRGLEAFSFDSHESNDIAITQHVTSRIQKIKDYIGRTNSADSEDGSIDNYESEGEMTELMNRLTRAAESLKTFHDHWDD